MREWVAIVIAGALGGFTATVLAEHYEDGTTGLPDTRPRGKWGWMVFWINGARGWCSGLVLNIIGGGLASFIL